MLKYDLFLKLFWAYFIPSGDRVHIVWSRTRTFIQTHPFIYETSGSVHCPVSGKIKIHTSRKNGPWT